MRTSTALAFAVVVTAWAGWLVVLPAVLDRDQPSESVAVVAALTYRIAGMVCHQDDVRSFHVGQWPVPVCARCNGLYVGAVWGVLAGLVLGRRTSRGDARMAVSLRAVRYVLVAAALPTGLFWLVEWLCLASVSNIVRAVGGLPLGAAVSWTVTIAILGVAMTDNLATNPSELPAGESS